MFIFVSCRSQQAFRKTAVDIEFVMNPTRRLSRAATVAVGYEFPFADGYARRSRYCSEKFPGLAQSQWQLVQIPSVMSLYL